MTGILDQKMSKSIEQREREIIQTKFVFVISDENTFLTKALKCFKVPKIF